MKTILSLALLLAFASKAEAQYTTYQSDSVLATTAWTALAKPTVGQAPTKRITRFEMSNDGLTAVNLWIAFRASAATASIDTASGARFILRAGETRYFEDVNVWEVWYKASAGTVPIRYTLF